MDINANHQNKQKNDKDDGVASQCKKKSMHNIMKVAPKNKTWQRDLEMMKALKEHKNTKRNIENGKDKFKKKAKQKSLHYFT